MSNAPKIPCPYCTKRHFTIRQAQCCADADTAEKKARERRLTLIRRTLKIRA